MREINLNTQSGYRFYLGEQGVAWQLPINLKCGAILFLSAGCRQGNYGADTGCFEIGLFRHAEEFHSGINLQEHDSVEGWVEFIELAKIIVYLQGKTLVEIDEIIGKAGHLPIRKEAGLED